MGCSQSQSPGLHPTRPKFLSSCDDPGMASRNGLVDSNGAMSPETRYQKTRRNKDEVQQTKSKKKQRQKMMKDYGQKQRAEFWAMMKEKFTKISNLLQANRDLRDQSTYLVVKDKFMPGGIRRVPCVKTPRENKLYLKRLNSKIPDERYAESDDSTMIPSERVPIAQFELDRSHCQRLWPFTCESPPPFQHSGSLTSPLPGWPLLEITSAQSDEYVQDFRSTPIPSQVFGSPKETADSMHLQYADRPSDAEMVPPNEDMRNDL